jgi:serine/threonine-protein phosphatase 2A regulatory subunit A
MKGYTIIIGQYLDELKSDDSKKRLNSVEHLLDIAKTLGPQRTKDELLPFLKGNFHKKINIRTLG